MISRARTAADEVLQHYMRLPESKAERIDTPVAFDRAVARLAAELRSRVQEPERVALKAARTVVNADWEALDIPSRDALIHKTAEATRGAIDPVIPVVGMVLAVAATTAVKATRAAIRETGFTVGAGLSALDQRVIAHLASSHTLFVRDAFGRRLKAFEQKAGEIVADGLERGFSRDAIVNDLDAAAAMNLISLRGSYWEVVAAAFTGQARSYAQVGSYIEAGLKAYRIEAVMDGVTSEVCKSMHGRLFQVSEGLRFIEESMKLESVDALKTHSPWGSAAVEASVPLPPYHELCRTTTVAV